MIALAVYYLVASCQAVLPWTVCDDSISLENTVCINAGENATQVLLDYPDGYRPVGSAEQYFLQNVLKEAEDINDGIGMPDLKLAACLGVCYILLFVTLWKGVASSGKVAYFTALFPYVVLFTLLGRGVTLPGGIQICLHFNVISDYQLFVYVFSNGRNQILHYSSMVRTVEHQSLVRGSDAVILFLVSGIRCAIHLLILQWISAQRLQRRFNHIFY